MKGFAAGLAGLLPRKVRVSLASSLIKDLQRRRDWSVHDWFSIASLERTLDIVRHFGLRTVVDVGAYHGAWTRQVRAIAPEAKVLMIDALEENERLLRQVVADLGAGAEMVMALLGDRREPSVRFHASGSGSSMLADVCSPALGTRQMAMTTLDAVLEERGLTEIDLLKLDVQGAELPVLSGAVDTLPRTRFVMLEVSFQTLYRESDLAADVVSYMRSQGFRLFDVCSFIRRPRDNALAQIDALFVRDDVAVAVMPGWR